MERALILWGLKAAIVVGAGLLVAQAMARASAAARHLVLCVSIAAALALPALSALLPELRVEALRWAALQRRGSEEITSLRADTNSPVKSPVSFVDRQSRASGAAAERETGRPVVRGTEGTRDDLPNAELPRTARRLDWVRFAVLLWASAALALLARAGWGWAQLATAARIARPVVDAEWQRLLRDLIVELRIARRVRLLQGDEPGVPVTWGVLRPCILIPPDATEEQMKAYQGEVQAALDRTTAFAEMNVAKVGAPEFPLVQYGGSNQGRIVIFSA